MSNMRIYHRIFTLILNVPCSHLPSTSPLLITLHHNILFPSFYSWFILQHFQYYLSMALQFLCWTLTASQILDLLHNR
jgi:hypothetical protein